VARLLCRIYRNAFTNAGAVFMAEKIKLDSVDRQILHDLQDHGRMTNVDLARMPVFRHRHAFGGFARWKMPVLSKAIMPILIRMRLAIVFRCLPLLV
jgi:hypothetical protein